MTIITKEDLQKQFEDLYKSIPDSHLNALLKINYEEAIRREKLMINLLFGESPTDNPDTKANPET